MSMTVQNLVDTACLLARADGIKRDVVAQLLVPRVATWVAQRAAAAPTRRALVTRTFVLPLVIGTAALPADVLAEYMAHASVADPADPTMAKKMRWIPDWREFSRPLDQSLGYFTVTNNGASFYMTRPGQAFDPVAGMTGNVNLTTSAKPAIAAGNITSAPEIDQELILALTAALKGDWQAIIAAEVPK